MSRRPLCCLLAALCSFAGAFVFDVGTGKTECFREQAKASDHISGDWRLDMPQGGEELPTLDAQVLAAPCQRLKATRAGIPSVSPLPAPRRHACAR